MGESLAQRFASLPREQRENWIESQEPRVLEEIARGSWWWLARPEQIPPEGPQLLNVFCAGRGAGKTRAGSEWIVDRSQRFPVDRHGTPTERIIVAETLGDARTICMEGPAGVLRVLDREGVKYGYKQSPKPMVTIKATGARIYCLGADSPNVARGMNAADAWLDEIIKWDYSYDSWYQGIMPSLRADLPVDHPRAFVTTTPKPIKLLQEWLERTDGSVHMIRGSTFDNAANLNKYALDELKRRYEGTAIGRQELYGEMLAAMEGALFKRSDIEAQRVKATPEDLPWIVVGVDPSLVGDADEMGVVVVGRSRDNHQWVLADETIKAAGRDAAMHVWRTLVKWNAHMVVYESNLGKQWMADVFTDAWRDMITSGEVTAGTTPPMESVDAKLGKKTRAEPVAMRSEQKMLHMVGPNEDFKLLEDEMTQFTSWNGKESPNRLDALVHASRFHLIREKSRGKIINPDDFGGDWSTGFTLGW